MHAGARPDHCREILGRLVQFNLDALAGGAHLVMFEEI